MSASSVLTTSSWNGQNGFSCRNFEAAINVLVFTVRQDPVCFSTYRITCHFGMYLWRMPSPIFEWRKWYIHLIGAPRLSCKRLPSMHVCRIRNTMCHKITLLQIIPEASNRITGLKYILSALDWDRRHLSSSPKSERKVCTATKALWLFQSVFFSVAHKM